MTEYWIINPESRKLHVLRRFGDVWEEVILGEDATHRTHLLPGLEVRVGELLGDEPMDDADEIGEA